MSQSISPIPLSMVATTPLTQTSSSSQGSHSSWFDAMSDAWGRTLDAKAQQLETASDQMGNNGDDTPSQMTQMTTLSQEMSFESDSAHTSLESVGQALDTLGRKQ